MGLVLLPEIKMARKVIEKHALNVPFNLDALVKQYATVLYKYIPFDGVDGICLHLKTAGKIPTIIVNQNTPYTRQKFTLAHELGHIIIPWHYGSIIDETDEANHNSNIAYWEVEREANRFASELLMPFHWILTLYEKNRDPHFLHSQISLQCGVSDVAAGIRLDKFIFEIEQSLMPREWISHLYSSLGDVALVHEEIVKTTKLSVRKVAEQLVRNLSSKIAYCIENNGIVVSCGHTKNTHGFFQLEGAEFVESPYQYVQNYSFYKVGHIRTHWWVLMDNFDIPDDTRTWQDILQKIATDITSGLETEKFKISVNAKLSGAYGNWKRKNPTLEVEKFIEDSIQRFDNPDYSAFIRHPEFLVFIKKRCFSLFFKP